MENRFPKLDNLEVLQPYNANLSKIGSTLESFRTNLLNSVGKDSLGLKGYNDIFPFDFAISLNMVANTSANISGIPTSSIEKANSPLLLSLNLAMDVCVGPLLAFTLY